MTRILIAMLTGLLFARPAAVLSQTAAPVVADPPLVTDGKPLAFDVVSIRKDNSESGPQNPGRSGPTPDGYRMQGEPLFALIQAAYLPSQGSLAFRPNQVRGLPAWGLNSVLYDIDAKISEADLSRWKDPALQPAMLCSMLQAMLADRFKLAIHRENQVIPIYEITLGNKPPKLKPAAATTLDEIRKKHPDAVALRNGMIANHGPNPGEQTFFAMTLQDFGTALSSMAGRPIQDKTGLTGRYDITFQMEMPPPPPDHEHPPVALDFFSSQIPSIFQDQLGLKLKATNGLAELLVIDHVEQPSAN